MSNRERSIRTEGIILRRRDFGEADRILVLFSRKLGRISCIAKGSRKPSSKISGHIDIFTRSSMLISRGRNLHLLTQAETIESYDELRKNLTGIGRGSYIVELVDAFSYEEGSNLKLYDLILATLESLNRGDNPSIVIHYYELHLLDLVGFRPELFNCVECGEKIVEQNQFISGKLGGVICPECIARIKDAAVRPVAARTLKYLRHFQRSSLQSLLGLDISAEILDDLEKVIKYYLTHILEGHLNSPDFMSRIQEM
jgi:DNA repair protein RecO (recombination protein O)